jgi:hypothetical protein
MIDSVDLEQNGKDDVMSDKLEIRVHQKVPDVLLPARKEVVQTEYFVSVSEQPVAEM